MSAVMDVISREWAESPWRTAFLLFVLVVVVAYSVVAVIVAVENHLVRKRYYRTRCVKCPGHGSHINARGVAYCERHYYGSLVRPRVIDLYDERVRW